MQIGKPAGSLYHAVVGVHTQSEDTIVLVKASSESDKDLQTAIKSMLDAESITGYKPKVIIATRMTDGTKAEKPKEQPNARPVESNQKQEQRSQGVITKVNEVKNS